MPEFILDLGSPESAAQYRQLDSFTQGYIEAMFFTDASDPDDGDLQHATVAELAPEALQRIIVDCQAFQSQNVQQLTRAYGMLVDGPNRYDAERAGNDYWYSRNGHGTGFWDRGLGEIGDRLHKAAGFHQCDLYRGDDGLIYLA